MTTVTMSYNSKHVANLDLESVEFEWVGKMNSGIPAKGDWKITTKSDKGTMVFWATDERDINN
tara:strand:+ start:1721 stop:1909 length:189 start_codon:yes stop_codon:yes gene_type:complete